MSTIPESTPPPPEPWAFAPMYSQPLPSLIRFDHQKDFVKFANHIEALSTRYSDHTPRVCPVIATYTTGKQKKSWTDQPQLTDNEKAWYTCGATLSTAAKSWKASGTVGVVQSSMLNAAEVSQGGNQWHAVAVARDGDQVFVHDPEYREATYVRSRRRMENVHGAGNIHKLALDWARVRGAWFQGPPDSFEEGQAECMGRSAQWVEATVNGTLPWPPNKDSSGGQWIWHDKN